MRASLMRMATSSTIPPSSTLGFSPGALLPPLVLYRRLLRVHRKKLPAEMRLLGDEYVKSEFRAHRNVENPMHIVSAFSLLAVFSSLLFCWVAGADRTSCFLRSGF